MSDEKKPGGLLKGILSNFIEVSEDKKKETPVETKSQSTVVNPTVHYTPQAGSGGVIDKMFVEYFEEMLGKMDIPGPDYMEYSKALENLKDSGLSEIQIYQTAWKAGFKAMGVTDPSVLVSTAQKYIDALNADKNGFLSEIQNKIDTEVGGLNQKAADLDKRNAAADAEIKRLQIEIDSNNKEKVQIYTQITDKSSKLSARKDNYIATHSGVVNMIQEHVNKIKTYIIQQ